VFGRRGDVSVEDPVVCLEEVEESHVVGADIGADLFLARPEEGETGLVGQRRLAGRQAPLLSVRVTRGLPTHLAGWAEGPSLRGRGITHDRPCGAP
jgi:hypothetical protein